MKVPVEVKISNANSKYLSQSAWCAVPSVELMRKISNYSKFIDEIQELWETAPADLKNDITKSYIGGNRKLFSWLMDISTFRRVFPMKLSESNFPPALYHFFMEKKDEVIQARMELALLEEEEKLIAEEEEKVAKAEAKKNLDSKIISTYNSTESITETSRLYGKSFDYVRKVLIEQGFDVDEKICGLSRYNYNSFIKRVEKSIESANLYDQGVTYKEISKSQSIGESTVKGSISDGRFYRNPLSRPERLNEAIYFHYHQNEIYSKNKKQGLGGMLNFWKLSTRI